ncbi:LysR family transcriptional regulator [Amycolatopsis thermoflava]|uniref:LysR family transcriptional regulator n=1 Tax=Amycolatopsis thermoflava TaxID=84480 RepID=UPI003665937A
MELPEFDDLRFFAGVAAASTLTEAGHRWGVSVSAVSKRLARLERRLDAQLINRSTRRFTLTPEGERYRDVAAEVLQRIDDVEDEIGRQRHGLRGRIAVQSSIGLGRAHVAPLLGELAAGHPQLRVDLELSHLPVHVGGTAFDFAVRVGPLPDSRLRSRLLHRNRRIVCAAPAYLREHGEPRTLDDLGAHSCIVIRENDTDYAIWRFGTADEPVNVRVEGTLTTNDGDVATDWCRAGRGLLMRSLWRVAPLLADGSLVPVLRELPTPRADVHAVLSGTRHPPRRVATALDHLVRGFARRLPDID